MHKARNVNAKSVLPKRPKFDKLPARGGIGLHRHAGVRRIKGVRS
jgi:hypothetical protein